MEYSFSSELKRWSGDGGWFYVRLPKDTYQELQEIGNSGAKRGFGSLKVEVTIGASSWKTSVFPDSEDKSYLLFIKKAIRQAENLQLGDELQVSVVLQDV